MTLHQHLLTLARCQNGQTAQITHLKGDIEMKKRLVNLGFHTHSIIELILVRGRNFIVTVDGSRFAIDETIAQQIEVEPLS